MKIEAQFSKEILEKSVNLRHNTMVLTMLFAQALMWHYSNAGSYDLVYNISVQMLRLPVFKLQIMLRF